MENKKDEAKKNIENLKKEVSKISATLKITHIKENNINIEEMLGVKGIILEDKDIPTTELIEGNEQWGKYKIIGYIYRNQESNNILLLGEDENLHRLVVIKLLEIDPFLEREYIKRFLEEAQILSQLSYPGIIPIYDIDLNNQGNLYYVMKYIKGERLDNYLEKNNLNLKDIVLLFLKICKTIEYIHKKGIIHLNLLPENILIDEEKNHYILGWSIFYCNKSEIKILDYNFNSNICTTGKLNTIYQREIGKINYFPPEVIEEQVNIGDERLDIYALGSLFFEMLSGIPPFEDNKLQKVIDNILKGNLIFPKKGRYGIKIPTKIKKIIIKALDKKNKRYQQIKEMIEDLENIILCNM